MRNYASVAPLELTKDFINDQTTRQIHEKINTSGLGFTAEGYGFTSSGSSTAFLLAHGGYRNQYAQAVMKYRAPTTQGTEDIGVMLRCLSLDSPEVNYYYARVDEGDAEIVKVIDGSFTVLSGTPFVLPQDELVTITFTAVESTLSATFTAATPGTVSLTAVDSDIPEGGSPGARSISSTIRVRTMTVRQLP